MWCRTEAMTMGIEVTGISITIIAGTKTATAITIGVVMDIVEQCRA